MLVLTRKKSEMIQIGDNIFVKVIRTGRGSVKIGIEAPPEVRVLRSELCDDGEFAAKGDGLELEPAEDEEPVAVACSDQFPHPHLSSRRLHQGA